MYCMGNFATRAYSVNGYELINTPYLTFSLAEDGRCLLLGLVRLKSWYLLWKGDGSGEEIGVL